MTTTCNSVRRGTLLAAAFAHAMSVLPAMRPAGADDTATGTNALKADTSGNYNTADGYNALVKSTTGLYHSDDGTRLAGEPQP